MRELGYVEGPDVIIEYRHEIAHPHRLPALAAELVAMKPDVLVAVTTNAALAVKKPPTRADRLHGGDRSGCAGLVESLASPGGNITGVTNMAAILTGKRLEFLKAALPAHAVAVLWDPKARVRCRSGRRARSPREKLRLAAVLDGGQQRRDYEAASGTP